MADLVDELVGGAGAVLVAELEGWLERARRAEGAVAKIKRRGISRVGERYVRFLLAAWDDVGLYTAFGGLADRIEALLGSPIAFVWVESPDGYRNVVAVTRGRGRWEHSPGSRRLSVIPPLAPTHRPVPPPQRLVGAQASQGPGLDNPGAPPG